MIAAIDIPVDSVVLETQFVELTETGAKALGIDFANANGQIGVVTYPERRSSSRLRRCGSGNCPAMSSAPSSRPRSMPRSEGQRPDRLQAADCRASGSTAKIITGDAMPILTAITLSGVNGVSQQVQYVNVGVTLQIAPRVSGDGFVSSHVFCVVSSVTGFSQGYPTISQREAETSATVRDGDSFVIGGLTQDEIRSRPRPRSRCSATSRSSARRSAPTAAPRPRPSSTSSSRRTSSTASTKFAEQRHDDRSDPDDQRHPASGRHPGRRTAIKNCLPCAAMRPLRLPPPPRRLRRRAALQGDRGRGGERDGVRATIMIGPARRHAWLADSAAALPCRFRPVHFGAFLAASFLLELSRPAHPRCAGAADRRRQSAPPRRLAQPARRLAVEPAGAAARPARRSFVRAIAAAGLLCRGRTRDLSLERRGNDAVAAELLFKLSLVAWAGLIIKDVLLLGVVLALLACLSMSLSAARPRPWFAAAAGLLILAGLVRPTNFIMLTAAAALALPFFVGSRRRYFLGLAASLAAFGLLLPAYAG